MVRGSRVRGASQELLMQKSTRLQSGTRFHAPAAQRAACLACAPCRTAAETCCGDLSLGYPSQAPGCGCACFPGVERNFAASVQLRRWAEGREGARAGNEGEELIGDFPLRTQIIYRYLGSVHNHSQRRVCCCEGEAGGRKVERSRGLLPLPCCPTRHSGGPPGLEQTRER